MTELFSEMDYMPTYENVFQGEYREVRLNKRKVICAACRKDGIVLAGARHFDAVMISQANATEPKPKGYYTDAEQGFIDQFGVFMTREDAWIVAEKQNQICMNPTIPGTLFSEDLY